MELYIRVHDGMTQKLFGHAAHKQAIRILVDGPYGGPSHSLRDYDEVLLLSGGSGTYLYS